MIPYRLTKTLAVCILLASFPVMAQQQTVTVGELVYSAFPESSPFHSAVGAFGKGAVAASNLLATEGQQPIFCAPERMRTGDYLRTISEFLVSNKSYAELPSTEVARVMVLALRDKFPCAK